MLSWDKPASEPEDRYIYDPRDPVPTHGGPLCCWHTAMPAGAFDQRSIETRDDILIYTSARLEEDMEVTGPIRVVLWVASSAVETDWTAKLVDVTPCGYARNICDGILRTSMCSGAQLTAPLDPEEILEVTISLDATSNVFLAGHYLRLEISSSNFPRFDRNPNTGQEADDEHLVMAAQRVYHDAQHPSHIVLPIIPT